MKKIQFLAIAIIGTIALFSMESCTNDNDEGPVNHLTFGEDSYQLSMGFVGYDLIANEDGIYNHETLILSPDFTIGSNNSANGKGEGIVIYFNCLSENKIDPGTYQFSNNYDEEFLVPKGIVLLNLNFNAYDEETEEYRAKSGSVTVKENNGEYEFTWNLQDDTGKKITGNFKGNMTADGFWR